MRKKDSGTKAVPYRQSPAYKQNMAIGRAIADQLVPVKSCKQVGAELGLSEVRVREIECLALAKLAVRCRELRTQGQM